MTYRELLARLNALTNEQLDSDVTVFVQELDEHYPLDDTFPFATADEDDEITPGAYLGTLDNDHPYFVI
jgi:hypothetical protein